MLSNSEWHCFRGAGPLLANVGVGYSYSLNNSSAARQNVHGFVGIPVPLYGMGTRGKPGFYLEPYYRPMLGISETDSHVIHEFGILFKYTDIKLGAGTNPKAIR